MRRRLPALLALVAGLLLGAGAGAQGVVASALGTAHPGVVHSVVTGTSASSSHETDAALPASPRPLGTAVARAGHASATGNLLRDAAVLPVVALLAVALVAFVGRQRRRSRPPSWHRSLLFARGPPLLLAP